MIQVKKITKEIEAKLKQPLPKEAVKPHPTKSYLSSIKAIYVVERLNEVFGIGSWSLKSEIIDNKTSMIVVRSTLNIPEYGISLESFGGNDNGGENSKNFDLGDAYKGACTDALTKICSYLEIGIDVFKGFKDGESKKTRPEFNESSPKFNDAWKAISEGTYTIEQMKHKYSLSESTIKKLTSKFTE